MRREKEGRESSGFIFIGVISRNGVAAGRGVSLDRMGVQLLSTFTSFDVSPTRAVNGFHLVPSGVDFGPRWNENAEELIGRFAGVEFGVSSSLVANGSPIGRGRGILAY